MEATAVLEAWQARSGAYSPGYYAYYGADEVSDAVLEVLEATVGADAAVLELGCSAGRHLARLHEAGYRDLTGIDINPAAREVLADAYPDLYADGTFHFDAIETVVAGLETGRFDAVFSVETLQHIHPDHDWVFEEVARVADDILVTVELEGDGVESLVDDTVPLYRRDWRAVFTDLGFEAVDAKAVKRDTLRVFRACGTR